MDGRGGRGRRPRARPGSRTVVTALVGVVLVASCGGRGGGADDGGAHDGDTTLTVFAAASLTATVTQLAEEFEAEHDGVTVRLNLGGSAHLAAQVLAGAPADVFASADVVTMDALGGAALDARDMATNTLQIAVPPGNPAGVARFADLARDDLRLVVCAPEVPCGRGAAEVADSAGVRLDPVSREQSVTDVLGKVSSGEADAGLVYVTDVRAAGDAVEGVSVPEASAAATTYRITTVEGGRQQELAREFVALVLGEQGRSVLLDAGFGTP